MSEQIEQSQVPEVAPSYLVQASPQAMLRFALGSACTIATLLCIPDGFAIMPDVASPLAWMVRIIGLWLSGYCLWTFGFLVMLYMVRAIVRGIELNDEGFRLWRFGRLVTWDSVRAITCEPQPFFSKVFCLKPMVHRLTIYSEKPDGKLTPHSVPSFQFSIDDFRSMLIFVNEKCFGLVPSGADLLVSSDDARAMLKASYERGRTMRVVMSVIIAISLVGFLGRRALLNYTFNMGNKSFRADRYKEAMSYYKTATTVDPTFAPAWDRLARSEYRCFRAGDAEEHYNRALYMRPDLVESKIGLATIHADRREWGKSRKLLLKALKLSPTNLAAAMSLADLDIRTMQYTEAIEVLKPLVDATESNERARALLARAYLRSGNNAEAAKQLAKHDHLHDNSGSDKAFVQLVEAELNIAEGKLPEAEKELNALTVQFGHQQIPEDLLLAWIGLRSAQANNAELQKLVVAARSRHIPTDEIDLAKRYATIAGGDGV